MPLRIGVHPNNLHLFLAQDWPGAFDGLDAEMVPYAEGRNSARMLAEDRIDVCGTGSTPPILAQAAGLPVEYLAASARRPANGGLLAAPSSAIRSIADLKGARVALLDGSFHTYLLARELERAGLSLADVQRIELSPGASLRALEANEVEAWVAMAPLLDQSLAAGRTRLLARCGDTIPNRSVFWTTRARALPPAVLDGFVAALIQFGEMIKAQPLEAAKRLAEAGADTAGIAAWRDVVSSRDWSIMPAGAQVGAEQQAEADTLLRHNDLPGPIDVAAALRRHGEPAQ